MKTNRLLLALLAVLPLVLFPANSTSASEEAAACPKQPRCGDNCSNVPFVPTDCWTTEYGPAKADVVIGHKLLVSPNMLYCDGGTYALCASSGPPYATGTSSQNRPLPCLKTKEGFAHCTCEVFTSGPYFVSINAILNRGAFYETVEKCGKDGSRCANMVNCGKDGTTQGCENYPRAPVCRYIENQNPNDPKTSLIPGADQISAFSFAMADDYTAGLTKCEGLYAGCMTAPCRFPEGATESLSDGDPIQCECPTYDSVYFIGQPDQKCPTSSDGWVWSGFLQVFEEN